MNAVLTSDTDRDQHLDEVLGAYLAALDADRAPEPAGLLANHPELANGLARFLADAELVTRWTAPLRTIAEAARIPRAERAAAGTRFGDYELLEEIGSGGMGVVYKARQRSLDRVVALKMIGAGRLSTAAERQRFRSEAETVARLDHPRIVPVYEVGEWSSTDAGPAVPYFSMKLFEGGSLADCLDRFAWSVAAARLVAEIARAVHHAHRRGVLHRDLKPSNILLDFRGQPYVTDFGLSKRLTSDSELTQSGTLLGTPSYMAPELTTPGPRAATTAADVYGLGAILYALLAGRPPFKGETALDTLALVRGRDAEPPRRYNPALDRDLEAICLKCLEKEPHDRYGSAEALAEDLERFLENRPIQAQPPTFAQRLTKLARRHRSLVWLLFGGLILAVAILAISTAFIWQEKRRTEAARAEEAKQRQRAEEHERVARQIVDEMYTKVAVEWLATEPRMQLVQRDILLKALDFYARRLREHPGDPQVRFKTAQAYYFVGRLQYRLGQYKAGEMALLKQIALLRDLVADVPKEPRYHFDLYFTLKDLAISLYGTGRDREVEDLQREALGLIERLVHEYPGEADYKDSLAYLKTHIGNVQYSRGEYQEAERAYREALAIARELTQAFPDKRTPPHYPANIARNLRHLGDVAQATGRIREAERFYRDAVRLLAKLARDFPEEPGYQEELGSYWFTLSVLLGEAGRTTEALELLEKSLAWAEETARNFPHLPGNRIHAALVRFGRGQLYLTTGDEGRAEKEFRAARHEYEKLIRDFPTQTDLKLRLALFLVDCPLARLHDPTRAAELVEQAAEATDPFTLGFVYYRVGRWAASMVQFDKAMQRPKVQGISAWFFMAMACWQQGEKERARRYFQEGAEWMDARPHCGLELRRCRAEAAALLELKDSLPPDKPSMISRGLGSRFPLGPPSEDETVWGSRIPVNTGKSAAPLH